MSDDNLSYQDLLQIIELIENSSQFTEFHLKVGEIEIDLRKKGAAAPAIPAPPAAPPQGGELSNGVVLAQRAPAPTAQTLPALPADAVLVKSPMVGTFYRAPAPGAEPFTEVGSRVTPATTICIIEVMKLMNSIAAGTAGVVTHIMAENGALVEFGQVLIVIDSSA